MRFEKGESGNPGGRPKAAGQLQDLAREHSEAALAARWRCITTRRHPAQLRCRPPMPSSIAGTGSRPSSIPETPDGYVALSLPDDELAAIAAGAPTAAGTEDEGAKEG